MWLPEMASPAALPDVRFRRCAGPADIPRLQAVLEAQARFDGNDDDLVTFSSAADEFEHPTGWVPKEHALIAELDGEIVAWSRIQHQPFTGEDAYRSRGYVLPAYRRRGLGTVMLRRNEQDLVAFSRATPGTDPRWLHAWVNDRMPAAIALFEKAGYEPFQSYYLMIREASSPRPPAPSTNLVTGPVTDADLPAFGRLIDAAFRTQWGQWAWSDEEIEIYAAQARDDPTTDLSLWRAVRQSGELVAGIHAVYDAATRTAVIDELGTLPAWRGQGAASLLLSEALDELERRGAVRTTLTAAADSREALHIYERFGFVTSVRGIGYRKAMPEGGYPAAG